MIGSLFVRESQYRLFRLAILLRVAESCSHVSNLLYTFYNYYCLKRILRIEYYHISLLKSVKYLCYVKCRVQSLLVTIYICVSCSHSKFLHARASKVQRQHNYCWVHILILKTIFYTYIISISILIFYYKNISWFLTICKSFFKYLKFFYNYSEVCCVIVGASTIAITLFNISRRAANLIALFCYDE